MDSWEKSMADEDTLLQLVTFQLGDELYGVDIMDVKEIVKIQNVRPIPNAPFYVEGIINLRGEVIPIINLHKRFYIKKMAKKCIAFFRKKFYSFYFFANLFLD